REHPHALEVDGRDPDRLPFRDPDGDVDWSCLALSLTANEATSPAGKPRSRENASIPFRSASNARRSENPLPPQGNRDPFLVCNPLVSFPLSTDLTPSNRTLAILMSPSSRHAANPRAMPRTTMVRSERVRGMATCALTQSMPRHG